MTSVDGLVVDTLLAMLLDDVEEVVLVELFNRAVDALQRLGTGTVPIGTGEALMMAVRTSSRLTPPVERSITVSAPYFTASFTFTSSAASEALWPPMLAFTLHLLAMPIAIGSRLVLMLAGMIMTPCHLFHDQRLRRFSRLATGHFLRHHALAGVMHLRDVGPPLRDSTQEERMIR